MKKNSLKVALNMSTLSVPEKINKARLIANAITNNASVFTSPNPAIATFTTAIDDLETAWNNAVDGGKSKTAIMHDKESELLKMLNDMAHYVEGVANGDDSMVHLAGMDVKRNGVKHFVDFDIQQGSASGIVGLKVRSRKKTIYRWEYCSDPATNTWAAALITGVCKATINGLAKGIYWFRVVFIDATGEHQSVPVSFAVN